MKNILFVICLLFMSFSSAQGGLLDIAIAEDVGRSAGNRAASQVIEEYKREHHAQFEKAAMWDEFDEYVRNHEGASKEELSAVLSDIRKQREETTLAQQKSTNQDKDKITAGEALGIFLAFMVVMVLIFFMSNCEEMKK